MNKVGQFVPNGGKFHCFSEKTFYKWAGNSLKPNFVDVRQRVLPQGTINDYSKADIAKIEPLIQPHVLTFTQAQAGFVVTLNEFFHSVEMPQISTPNKSLDANDHTNRTRHSTHRSALKR